MKTKAKILVVDDDSAMTDLLSDFLSRQGYAVETASSVAQALRLYHADPIESAARLILSDVKMGSTSGLELTRMLKGKNPDVSVILFSAFATRELEKEAVNSGAHSLVAKPFSLTQLATLVKSELKPRG